MALEALKDEMRARSITSSALLQHLACLLESIAGERRASSQIDESAAELNVIELKCEMLSVSYALERGGRVVVGPESVSLPDAVDFSRWLMGQIVDGLNDEDDTNVRIRASFHALKELTRQLERASDGR